MSDPGADRNYSGEPPPPRSSLELKDYDPTQDRERVRGWIAIALPALVVGIVLVLLAGILLHAITMDDLHKLAAVILSPVVGLFGAVVGFHYGEQSRRRG